jgi:phage major head subunit gpT-like protein
MNTMNIARPFQRSLDMQSALALAAGDRRIFERPSRRHNGMRRLAGKDLASIRRRTAELHAELSSGSQGGRSLDADKIEAAYIGYHTLFHNRLKTAVDNVRRFATIVSTNELLDRQLWLSANPRMRIWEGEKVRNKLRGESHTYTTKPHEATIEIPKHDILNDRFGMYRDRINALGESYEVALTELVVALLVAGSKGTALGTTYDNQNLLDTDHTALSVGGTSQVNFVDGVLDEEAFREALVNYANVKDEHGRPQNVSGRRMTLLVGPDNEEAAEEILRQTFKTGGESNLTVGRADLVVSPWITEGTINALGVDVDVTGDEWFLIPEGSSSVIVHVKREPEFLSLEDGDHAFSTGQYQYSIEAEFGGGYGLWQEIQGGDGAV